MPFDGLADDLMGADEDVYLAGGEVGEQLLGLLGGLEAAEVLDANREVLHPLGEGVVVLQRQHGGRHENGYLFAVRRYLERRTHGYLGLAESHIAADEPVHRHRALQVAFDLRGRFRLVGRVLVEERRLQLVLHVPVGRVGKAFLLLARGVETDQVARNLLDFVLRALFEPLPCTRTKAGDGRFRTLAAFVLGDTVQVVDGHKHVRTVAVVQFDHLLRLAVHRRGDESAELGDTVVGVDHVIAYLQLVDLAQGNDRFAAPCVLARQLHAVVPLEDLVVGVAADFQLPVHKPLMERCVDTGKSYRRSRSYSVSGLTVTL